MITVADDMDFNAFFDGDMSSAAAGMDKPVIGGLDRLSSLLGGFDAPVEKPAGNGLGAYANISGIDAAVYKQQLQSSAPPSNYWSAAPQQPAYPQYGAPADEGINMGGLRNLNQPTQPSTTQQAYDPRAPRNPGNGFS